MKAVYEAVYDALVNDSELLERVSTENIRRGLQEPSEFPSVRFYAIGSKAAGDDLSSAEMINEIFTVSIIMDNDLTIERVADSVIKALKIENLTHSEVIFHSSRFRMDNRGSYFEPLRKKHRKDISFTLVYSPA